MYDSIIFDLDGTLWDTTVQSTQVLAQTLARYPHAGEVSRAEVSACMGLLLPDIARRLFPRLPHEEGMEIIDDFAREICVVLAKEGGVLYPLLHETLAKLSARFPLFLVSNCQEGYIQAFFSAHGTEKFFVDFEYPGRTGLPKAENIAMVAKRNGLENPVYVGDTAGDEKSAKQAGVPFIFARYGLGEAQEYAAVIDSLAELSEIV